MTDVSYHVAMAMKGITIKLPEGTLRRLEQEARATGRSVAAVIRERVERVPEESESVYSRTLDLAGSVSGSRKPASNERRKFRPS
jgi:predicted DNA-binding protein